MRKVRQELPVLPAGTVRESITCEIRVEAVKETFEDVGSVLRVEVETEEDPVIDRVPHAQLVVDSEEPRPVRGVGEVRVVHVEHGQQATLELVAVEGRVRAIGVDDVPDVFPECDLRSTFVGFTVKGHL